MAHYQNNYIGCIKRDLMEIYQFDLQWLGNTILYTVPSMFGFKSKLAFYYSGMRGKITRLQLW